MAYVDGVAAQARRGVLRSLSLSVLTSHKETAAKVLEDGSVYGAPQSWIWFGGVKRAGRPFIRSLVRLVHSVDVHGRSRAIAQCLLGIIARRLVSSRTIQSQTMAYGPQRKQQQQQVATADDTVHDSDGGGIPAARLLTAAPLGCAAGARLGWALAVCSFFCGRG